MGHGLKIDAGAKGKGKGKGKGSRPDIAESEFHSISTNCKTSSPDKLKVASWNAAGSDTYYKTTARPMHFFARNRNRDLVLLQETSTKAKKAAAHAGFDLKELPGGLCIAYKSGKLTPAFIDAVVDTAIPGSGTGGERNGSAACALFHLTPWGKHKLPVPVRVLNIHAGHNKHGGKGEAVEALKQVWLRQTATPLNVLGGDMNECHLADTAQYLIGNQFDTHTKTHNMGAPDQLGARGGDMVAFAKSEVKEKFGSDHHSKTLTITLK